MSKQEVDSAASHNRRGSQLSAGGEEDGIAEIRSLRRKIGAIEAVVAEREETIRTLLARLESPDQAVGAAWSRLHEEYRANTARLDERRNEADRAWFDVARRRAETEELRRDADEAWSAVERHRAETEELRREADKAWAEVERQRIETEELRREADKAWSEVERQRIETEDVRREADKAWSEVERQRIETEDVRREADKAWSEVERQRIETEDRRREADEAWSEVEQNRAETEDLRREADKAWLELERRRAETEDLKREVLQSRSAIDDQSRARRCHFVPRLSEKSVVTPSWNVRRLLLKLRTESFELRRKPSVLAAQCDTRTRSVSCLSTWVRAPTRDDLTDAVKRCRSSSAVCS